MPSHRQGKAVIISRIKEICITLSIKEENDLIGKGKKEDITLAEEE